MLSNIDPAAGLLDGKIIGVAGFGHLGSSVVSALLTRGFPRERLMISCGGSAKTLSRIREAGLEGRLAETPELLRRADVAVLAARPQQLTRFRGMKTGRDTSILSFMAGVSLETLRGRFSAPLYRVMCSGPETITEGCGVDVSFPAEAVSRAVLEAAGLKLFELSCESELDSFTVGICIPPILLNTGIEAEEKNSAMLKMARRYPVYRELSPWIDGIVASQAGKENAASLANVSTKGGVTEAMVEALKGGSSFYGAIEAGLARNIELRDEMKRQVGSAAA